MAQVVGIATTLAEVQEADLLDYVTGLADRMAMALSDNPEGEGKKLEAARARYRFIEAGREVSGHSLRSVRMTTVRTK
jgi:hypothetical protein